MTDEASLAIRRAAVQLSTSAPAFPQITPQLAQSKLVLLGEASHGTHEFYRIRASITRELIEVFGFNAVVVEADWPAAYRVNRWVRGMSRDRTADEALSGFQRFPQWMWRNRDVVDFITWLRDRNQRREPADRAGFYGMDLYSLHASIDVVLGYLEKVDPPAARRARDRYACLEQFGDDPQAYGYATAFGMSDDCEEEVIDQLVDLRRRAAEYAGRDGRIAEDDYFFSEQNARVVLNAERYYRTMFRGREESWNLRDRHMFETLEALMAHLGRGRGGVRLVVWAHNSHLGDARATEMGERGEVNVGQLVRERYEDRATLVGFTTHDGTVTAASEWDAPAGRKRILPSMPGSCERLFHDSQAGDFMIRTGDSGVRDVLAAPMLERAIGVIYKPETERWSHYFRARLAEQFNMVIHVDTTQAVEPLEKWPRQDAREPAETYPTGI